MSIASGCGEQHAERENNCQGCVVDSSSKTRKKWFLQKEEISSPKD
jgi:hypothetical protein